ncbi:MAG: SDR family oxidoreductase [Alphaproteobacteria bacterium]|nr:SDR family oxidoreductase [Alphaproteobacteria bacterium]
MTEPAVTPPTARAYATRYLDLAGRTVFVSGGATGIGAEIVTAFAAQDATVCFVDVDARAGEALSAALGARARFSELDVTDTAALQAEIARVSDETGDLAVLVNNAARDLRVAWDEITPDGFDDLVAVNLKHQLFAAQAAARVMERHGGGSIINFGSIAPSIGVPDLAVYSSCKAAAFGLTRSLARDLGHLGIRVNSVVPGAILTERQRRDWISPEDEAAILARQCLKRAMQADDVAEMVLFLASCASRGCTAQEFRVDGGNI